MGTHAHWRKQADARQPDPSVPAAAQRQYLRFRIGERQMGITLDAIRELLEYQPLTTLPRMSPLLAGVLNLRGNGVPVLNLAHCLGLPASPQQRRSCIIILQLATAAPASDIGILVDEVHAVEDIANDAIEAPPQLGKLLPPGLLAGMVREAQGFTLLLDAGQLLTPDVLSQLCQTAATAVAAAPDSPLPGDKHD
ncbi:chemotaxis protein CheW [Aquitalea denitrificans]|uniref:chemotaxis protein CheW n=1 Tax=Aquitalea denitrificans TaxID=519081 RepID=UPI001356FFEA|nr:chemotaxis protein CheW [Aquitalea denitrificans]